MWLPSGQPPWINEVYYVLYKSAWMTTFNSIGHVAGFFRPSDRNIRRPGAAHVVHRALHCSSYSAHRLRSNHEPPRRPVAGRLPWFQPVTTCARFLAQQTCRKPPAKDLFANFLNTRDLRENQTAHPPFPLSLPARLRGSSPPPARHPAAPALPAQIEARGDHRRRALSILAANCQPGCPLRTGIAAAVCAGVRRVRASLRPLR